MNTNQNREEVAAEVRAAVARKGWQQADLARATGLNKSSLSRKLRGEVSIYVDELVLIAIALDIDPGDLLPRVPQTAAA